MNQHWDQIIASLPEPHFLQSWEWGQVKAQYGWQPLFLAWDDKGRLKMDPAPDPTIRAACMVLKRTVLNRGFAARLSILYAPKGPLLDRADAPLRKKVLDDLQDFARRQGAIFLKLDPDLVIGRGEIETPDADGRAITAELVRRGWVYSADQIQFRNTVLIDLSPTEEEMLARMKSKTRYNVRLAEKKGVQVRVGTEADLPMLYKMYAETSVRDGFVIRSEDYYLTVWKIFLSGTGGAPSCQPLIAEVEGQPVAAIFLFLFADRAYYVYGMSRSLHREKMPTYLLQWEAMKRARSAGCRVYDLWGAPEVFDESDSMWGVYRFKEGLGGEVVRTSGAYDFAPNRLWYKMYADIMPRVLDVMRSRGREKTKQSLD